MKSRKMIFLSAQPDEYYFLWQLEIQLHNFHEMGIPANEIHVLIGYNPNRGLSKEFKDFINTNQNATFFIYSDMRENKKYPPSIRPHIIKQHFKEFPILNKAAIFYYDSDIIFSGVPEFGNMINDEVWYVSDTSGYLNSQYIIRKGSEGLFFEMCSLIGVSSETVIANDDNAGGAQYFLKSVSYEFWNKVEDDCERIYGLLLDYNDIQGESYYQETGRPISKYRGIQAWCSDMWAILWNAWLFGYNVKIHSELDFCWPYDYIEEWHRKKILHYAGVTDKENEKAFCKGRYIHYPPYYDDLNLIDKTTCSYPILQLINDFQEKKSKCKIDLEDVSFLFSVRIRSEDKMDNLSIIIDYLFERFKTKIIVLEADKTPAMNIKRIPPSVKYFFYEDNDEVWHRTKYNNILINLSETSVIAICDFDTILCEKQILSSVEIIKEKRAECAYFEGGDFMVLDSLFKAMFGKLLDTDTLLMNNRGKFRIITKRYSGGLIFFNKRSFIEAGMENEYIKGCFYGDVERIKRLKVLGINIKRLEGPLFYLPDKNEFNYSNICIKIDAMEEYLKVCGLNKDNLKKYIQSWPWLRDNLSEMTKA